MGEVIKGNRNDALKFNNFRNEIWKELREQYPEKMDPSKLEGEKLKDGECPAKFLRAFQKRWREETGSNWNSNNTTESLFKVMVKKALPPEVQKRLDNVVGLMKMKWPLFSEHIIHHVEGVRKEVQMREEANRNLASKLTELQVSELNARQKKR